MEAFRVKINDVYFVAEGIDVINCCLELDGSQLLCQYSFKTKTQRSFH